LIYKPRDYQKSISAFIKDNHRGLVFAGMGTGKTPSTLDALADLLLFGEAKHILILAPKRVALSTWPGELRKFSNLSHLEMAVAVGSPSERAAALAKRAQITVCTYDLIPWLIETIGDQWFFDTIIADEVSKLKSLRVSLQRSKTGKLFLAGQGGVRAKALAKFALGKTKRFIGLTGTPAPNGIQDLWAQVFLVDMGRRLGNSFTAYVDRFFQRIPSGDGFSQIKPLKHAQAEVESLIKDVTITIEAKDYFDLPPLLDNVLHVDLPPAARKQYREMEKELFTEIAGTEVTVFNAAAMTNKCLQIASGAAYIDDQGNWAEVHDEKLHALDSIIEEAAGMPVLVAYQFKSDLARILKRFPQARTLTQDPKMIDDWNAGKVPLLVVHPASAGHGLSLQHGSNILVFYSTSWNLENDQQVIERIGPTRQAQSGYNRPVFVHRIVARDTLEETVVERIRTKASVQDALLQALKRRG
jgi:SNF2 family DNA or RNA helicase